MPQEDSGMLTQELQPTNSIGSSNSLNLNTAASNNSLNNNNNNIMNNRNIPVNNTANIQKIERKQSTRSIRSPLPLSHAISRQHNTTNANHHRQYILLRDKSQNNSNPTNISSPSILPDATSNPKSPQLHSSSNSQSSIVPGKHKPYLRKQPSAKYVFSVDDNEDEIEQDLTREYLEGYTDALRQRFKPNIASSPTTQPNSPIIDKKKELENEVTNNLQQVNKSLKELKELELDSQHRLNNDYEELLEQNENPDESGNHGEDENENENMSNNDHYIDNQHDDDFNDNASIASNESFTLRERQVAINETHPFGIRIWKPAIYKKDRSVQKEAEMDIHGVPGDKPSIGYSVRFFNVIWSFTFGLLLFLTCTLLGTSTFFISMFCNPRTNNSIEYAKFYWNLGYYLLYPFGKIVILKSDKNYINEDANVGSSLDEFERWRTQNQGKLFFSAPNVYKQNVNVGSTHSRQQRDPESQTPIHVPASVLQDLHSSDDTDEEEENTTFYKRRYFGRGEWNIGRIMFYLQYYSILVPLGFVISFITWLSAFCIPMAKVLTIMASHIRRHPLALSFVDEEKYYQSHISDSQNKKNESFLILTYRSFGFHYYKYTVDGTNIFFINLNFLVIFTILDFYLFKNQFDWGGFLTNSTFIFVMCLVSIIPLAYFIGQAVASISAQTSMGLGAVINAFFSTIVEIYLYCIALDQSKAKLVEGSIIGSILGGVLLLPGGSMCFGAIRRKTQRYNPASAGVSSTMLLYAILVMLSPTILYEIYGEYKVRCQACDISIGEDCRNCHYYQPSVVIDPLYINYLRPFTVICALSLFLVYCICLWFTLKTHAALIWSTPVTNKEKKLDYTPSVSANPESENHSVTSFNLNDQNLAVNNLTRPLKLNQNTTATTNIQQIQTLPQTQQPVEPSGGHDAPNWSRTKSTTILLSATLLYAIIAEILVDCVDDVLKSISINPKFLGLTIFALVPNTTEFVNAFSFAIHGNVALSMEIGSAYALQVCLLQIPIVVLYSVWNFTKVYTGNDGKVQMLISKSINGEWNGLPTLSRLLGFSSNSIVNIAETTSIPIEDAIAGTFGLFSSTEANDVLNIGVDKIFSLIFPHWDFIASLIGVYMFTYIYTEGKSNYFKGSILIFLYVVLISGFYFALQIDHASMSSFDPIDLVGGRVWSRR